MKKIALISHGCPKNLVDSELILGILSKNGFNITLNENETDIVITKDVFNNFIVFFFSFLFTRFHSFRSGILNRSDLLFDFLKDMSISLANQFQFFILCQNHYLPTLPLLLPNCIFALASLSDNHPYNCSHGYNGLLSHRSHKVGQEHP